MRSQFGRAQNGLEGLKKVADDFINGKYSKTNESKQYNVSLSDFIGLLLQTKESRSTKIISSNFEST